MYVRYEITALMTVAPEEAKKQIIKVYKKAQASRRGAAKLLAVNEHTFAKWEKKLGLSETFAEIKAQAREDGWICELGGAHMHKDPEAKTKRTKATWQAKKKAKETPKKSSKRPPKK